MVEVGGGGGGGPKFEKRPKTVLHTMPINGKTCYLGIMTLWDAFTSHIFGEKFVTAF